jgi:hypothetical protein
MNSAIYLTVEDAQSFTTASVPNIKVFWSTSRSMMMLNVSQMLARANQENKSEKILYCTTIQNAESSLEDKIRDVQGLERAGRTCEKFRVLTCKT